METPALGSPHIIIIVVIQLHIVAKRRMPILVMVRAVRMAVLVAMLIMPVGLVAIAWIIIVVVHGCFIICSVPIVLLLLLLLLRLLRKDSWVSRPSPYREHNHHSLLDIADIEDTRPAAVLVLFRVLEI